MASKIRKGDEVIVLSGKDKRRRGEILKVFPSEGKVLVSGINLIKKHQKPVPSMNLDGGIIEKEAALSTCKVAIYNETTGKADRIGFRVDQGKKLRIFKSTGAPISVK